MSILINTTSNVCCISILYDGICDNYYLGGGFGAKYSGRGSVGVVAGGSVFCDDVTLR